MVRSPQSVFYTDRAEMGLSLSTLIDILCPWRWKTNHKLARDGKFTNTTDLLTLSVSFKVREEQNLQIRLLCGSVVYFTVARWLNKWKPLHTNRKWPRSFTLIVFLHENELFQRGWGVFVTLVEIWKRWRGPPWNSLHGGVWIFSGTTHYDNDNDNNNHNIFFIIIVIMYTITIRQNCI